MYYVNNYVAMFAMNLKYKYDFQPILFYTIKKMQKKPFSSWKHIIKIKWTSISGY